MTAYARHVFLDPAQEYGRPSSVAAGGNFIFRNPARNCTITIAYCVSNLQCIGYFLLNKKIDELTSKNGSTENRTRVIWEENNRFESQQLIDSYTKRAQDRCLGYYNSPLTFAIVSPNMRDFESQGL